MSKFLKKLFIVLVLICFLTAFSDSYTSYSIDNLAVVVALAIDTSTTNNLQVTFQFTNSTSVSQSGSTEKSPSIIFTIDASSISSAINLMNTNLGKELNLSHCKLIVFSEELASKGISEEIYTLINDVHIRPSTNIAISKSSAKTYIKNSKPTFENLLTKYYEVFANSSQYTGYTSNATIGEFFNSLVCNTCEPYAILGGISSESVNNSIATNSQKDSSGKSNESFERNQTKSENTGLAVFKDSNLVGELNSIETLSFLVTRNSVKGFLVSVPNPEEKDNFINIYINPTKNCSKKVNIINGSPYISISYKFTGRIYSINENSQYLKPELLDNISNSCNSYLESIFSNYLYKSSKELKSDINDFGSLARKKFLTQKDFDTYNWREKYKDAYFNVTVDTSIKSSYLLTET